MGRIEVSRALGDALFKLSIETADFCLCLLACGDVAEQPAQAKDPLMAVTHRSDAEDGWEGGLLARLHTTFPFPNPLALTRFGQKASKPPTVGRGDKGHERFAPQPILGDMEEGSRGTVRLLDHPVGVRYQEAIRSEVEETLVALTLCFHSLATLSQLLVLLAQFFRGRGEFFQQRGEQRPLLPRGVTQALTQGFELLLPLGTLVRPIRAIHEVLFGGRGTTGHDSGLGSGIIPASAPMRELLTAWLRAPVAYYDASAECSEPHKACQE